MKEDEIVTAISHLGKLVSDALSGEDSTVSQAGFAVAEELKKMTEAVQGLGLGDGQGDDAATDATVVDAIFFLARCIQDAAKADVPTPGGAFITITEAIYGVGEELKGVAEALRDIAGEMARPKELP